MGPILPEHHDNMYMVFVEVVAILEIAYKGGLATNCKTMAFSLQNYNITHRKPPEQFYFLHF